MARGLRIGHEVTPAWYRSLPTDGTWAQAGANTIADVDPANDPLVNPNYPGRPPWMYTSDGVCNEINAVAMIKGWGGGALDLPNKRLVQTGEGHGDGASNAVFGLELLHALPTFVRYSNPSGASLANGALDDGQEASNQHADGRPRSPHLYGSAQVYQGHLYLGSLPAPFRSAVSTYGCFWRHNIATDTWTRLLQETTAGGAGIFFNTAATCIDTQRGRMYGWCNDFGSPSYYDFAAGTFAKVAGFASNLNTTESWLQYIPELDIQLMLNRLYSGYVGVYDYGRTPNDGSVNTPGATGDAPGDTPSFGDLGYAARMYPNGCWTPGYGGGVGASISWHGGRNLRVLTPPAAGNVATTPWAWSLRTIPTGPDPGAVNPNGLFGRWFYIPEWRLFGLVKDYDQAPWWLRLPDAWFA